MAANKKTLFLKKTQSLSNARYSDPSYYKKNYCIAHFWQYDSPIAESYNQVLYFGKILSYYIFLGGICIQIMGNKLTQMLVLSFSFFHHFLKDSTFHYVSLFIWIHLVKMWQIRIPTSNLPLHRLFRSLQHDL